MAFGCGQCLPCRVNRKRVWSHRIMLEALNHENNSFLTLTYSEHSLPSDRSVHKGDPIKFIRKLRKRLKGQKIRYYLVGEYGDEEQRPHYHLVLFGYPQCIYGRSQYVHKRQCSIKCDCKCCGVCDFIKDTWNKGLVEVGEVNKDSAAYVAKYVTKALTTEDNDRNRKFRAEKKLLLDGRNPEFCTMSRRPGIGAAALDELTNILTTEHGCNSIAETQDVPQFLKHGKKRFPLGRYLKTKLRERVGDENIFKKESIERYAEEMRQMLKEAREDSPEEFKEVRKVLFEKNEQKIRSLEARLKIWNRSRL